jgi:hypothetical protein
MRSWPPAARTLRHTRTPTRPRSRARRPSPGRCCCTSRSTWTAAAPAGQGHVAYMYMHAFGDTAWTAACHKSRVGPTFAQVTPRPGSCTGSTCKRRKPCDGFTRARTSCDEHITSQHPQVPGAAGYRLRMGSRRPSRPGSRPQPHPVHPHLVRAARCLEGGPPVAVGFGARHALVSRVGRAVCGRGSRNRRDGAGVRALARAVAWLRGCYDASGMAR